MAHKPSERSHSSESVSDTAEVNLAPVMSILVILIPVLLFTFTFFQVKIQPVSAPRLGSGHAQQTNKKKKPLNLTVLITSKGFVVKQQAELTTEPDKPIYKRMVTENGKHVMDYDYATLYDRLMAKKRQYPDETTINIGAEMTIPWHIIARTIDATRVQLQKDSYEEMAAYMKAKPKLDAQHRPLPLFPAVVFVVAE